MRFKNFKITKSISEKMSTIIFAIADSISHYNASYKIANRLRENGHKVIYIGDSIKREKEVKGQRFEFEVIYGEFNKKFQQEKKKGIFGGIHNYFARLKYLADYKKALLGGEEINKLFVKYKPDLFVIDVFHILHAVSIQQYPVKTILLQTYISTDKDTGIPPLNSSYIPSNSPGSKLRVSVLWQLFFARKLFFNLLGKIICMGNDTRSLIKAAAEVNGVDYRRINYKRSFHPGMNNIPELILSAKEFDFSRNDLADRHYVGPMVEMNRRDMLYDDNYLNVVLEKEIRSAVEDKPEKPLVYCSLGTLNVSWYKQSGSFFELLIDVFRQASQYELFIATGTDIKLSDFGNLPDNVHIFQLVPQLDILERASLMITHGGINSINECVFSRVPMIVYPLSKEIDQPGNAARIVHHGLGLRGDIRNETAAGILNKIETILSDSSFKDKLAIMKEKFDQYNGAETAVKFINEQLGVKTETKHKTAVLKHSNYPATESHGKAESVY
jgi:zeaxanthin glucosyltransferase